jgi:hypothetical protein
MKINPLPPIERLRELLSYDEFTGELRWRIHRGGKATAGSVAGSINKDGYRQIGLAGNLWQASRIAYAIYHGVDPYPLEIDHDNRIRNDNSIINLKPATHKENSDNKDYQQTRERIIKINEGKRKPVTIRYPDGQVIIAQSVTEAAAILNKKSKQSIIRCLKNDGIVYKKGRGKTPTGITLSYA